MHVSGHQEARHLRVEVVFAAGPNPFSCCLKLAAGERLIDAIVASGLLAHDPALEVSALRLGVFGTPRDAVEAAQDGDRIEIYQPLKTDAKSRRRLLARAAARSKAAAKR